VRLGLRQFDIALVGPDPRSLMGQAVTLAPRPPPLSGAGRPTSTSPDPGCGLRPNLRDCPRTLGVFHGISYWKGAGGRRDRVPLTPPIATSLLAASLGREKVGPVKGWHLAAAVLAAPVAVWLILPVGREAWIYAILHVIGLVEILLLGSRITRLLNSKEKPKLALGILLTSYPATMAGHMVGTIIFALVLGPTAGFFMALTPVTAVERAVISIIATAVGAPLVIAVRQMGRRRGGV